jgi:hypothetical protein
MVPTLEVAMSLRRWCLVLGLMGCPASNDADTGSPHDDWDPDCSPFTVASSAPAAETTQVFVGPLHDAVQVTYDQPPSLAVLRVETEDGRHMSGEQSQIEPGVYRWEPLEVMAPDTRYLVSAESMAGCGHEPITSFTTGPWASAGGDELAGAMYWLDLANAGVHGPGGVIVSMMEAGQLLWFRDGDATTADLTWVPLDDADTQSCLPTVDTEASVWGPRLASTVTAPIGNDQVQLWWVEVQLHALVGDSGLERVAMSGQVDVSAVFGCDYLASLGAESVACADGQGDGFVDFTVTDGTRIDVGGGPAGQHL